MRNKMGLYPYPLSLSPQCYTDGHTVFLCIKKNHCAFEVHTQRCQRSCLYFIITVFLVKQWYIIHFSSQQFFFTKLSQIFICDGRNLLGIISSKTVLCFNLLPIQATKMEPDYFSSYFCNSHKYRIIRKSAVQLFPYLKSAPSISSAHTNMPLTLFCHES